MKNFSLHFRALPPRTGYRDLVSPESAPLEHVTLGLQRVECGDVQSIHFLENETALVLLEGKITVAGPAIGASVTLERKSVFTDPAAAVYLAAGDEVTIGARSTAEFAVARAPAAGKSVKTQIVLPADVRRKNVGRDNWSRVVCDILPGDFPAEKLIVGETFNPPGNWSSSPPHKHDRDNPPVESQLEEVYFYRFEPAQGFALQRVYTAEGDLDVCYAVGHNDVVVLPRGYHPVVAAPGYRLYYLWVLAGRSRDPVWFEDPAHRWIRDGAPAQAGGDEGQK